MTPKLRFIKRVICLDHHQQMKGYKMILQYWDEIEEKWIDVPTLDKEDE